MAEQRSGQRRREKEHGQHVSCDWGIGAVPCVRVLGCAPHLQQQRHLQQLRARVGGSKAAMRRSGRSVQQPTGRYGAAVQAVRYETVGPLPPRA